MARLFVAVVVPPAVLDVVDALPRPIVEGLRWTTREQWHVTLRFLGAVDDVTGVASVAGVADELHSVRGASAVAAMGPQVARFGQRVLQVPVTGLDDLAAAVVGATSSIGIPPEDRPFSGHLTLARVRGRRHVDLRPLVGAPVGASWPVAEVCLFESHLHPEGARYDVVERVPLS
jgi:2'-5' RNA ligase